jgi:hypothetical protein
VENSKFDPPTAGMNQNPALLGRNPKQIQMTKIQITKAFGFENLNI